MKNHLVKNIFVKKMAFSVLFQMALLSLTMTVQANVCGTDYQTFNPTTNGLDFVSVQSSETLKPCIINFGAFLNYSVNTLTTSRAYTDGSGTTYQAGQKPNDKLTSLDLGLGIGLSSRWDMGINVPFVLKQTIDNDTLNSNYKSTGATEIKLNTKYKLTGDETEGVAVIASVNHNLIKNNPFTGTNPNPTYNLEIAADTTIQKFAAGINFGYRWRNPGSRVTNVPFDPLGNQIIYSLASSYYASDWDTKFIFEIFGGHFVEDSNPGSQKQPDSLEWQLGIKHDLSNNMALHFGGGTQLAHSLGSPESRIYLGLNWAIGPICHESTEAIIVKTPHKNTLPETIISPERTNEIKSEAIATNDESPQERLRYSAAVLFDFNSDLLRQQDIPEVDQYFSHINLNKIRQIEIEGHTDSRGQPEYNMNLSQRRALAMKRYLMNKFPELKKVEISTRGYGATRPIADNSNYQGRQQNRRVEFVINH